MFKTLLATAAITVCCLGNEYPAKACIGCSQDLINSSNYQRMLRMQQEMEHQRHLQQRMERMQRRQAAQRYGSQW